MPSLRSWQTDADAKQTDKNRISHRRAHTHTHRQTPLTHAVTEHV